MTIMSRIKSAMRAFAIGDIVQSKDVLSGVVDYESLKKRANDTGKAVPVTYEDGRTIFIMSDKQLRDAAEGGKFDKHW